MHIPKAKLPFYPPYEVKYRLQNGVSTICFRMGKTSKTKTLVDDFKVTTPKNPLLSQQAVTKKGISIPYTNL